MSDETNAGNLPADSLVARDVMKTPVHSVHPNGLIEDALDRMLQHRVSGLPVVDEHGRLVGIVSEFDILTLLFESRDEFRLVEPVAHFMNTQVETVAEDASLAEICALFRRRSVRRLPVMRGDQLVGIISRRDLVQVIRELRCRLALAAWQPAESGGGW